MEILSRPRGGWFRLTLPTTPKGETSDSRRSRIALSAIINPLADHVPVWSKSV